MEMNMYRMCSDDHAPRILTNRYNQKHVKRVWVGRLRLLIALKTIPLATPHL